MSLQWFVIHTHPQKELIACENLKRQGITPYMPRYKRLRRHARRVDTIHAPLFPRYIFAEMNLKTTNWLSINSTRGVSYILCNDANIPASIPNNIIIELQKQHNEDGIVSLAALELFKKGEKVRIKDGTFRDQIATFEKMTDQQRVELLINLIQSEVKITVPLYSVEKA